MSLLPDVAFLLAVALVAALVSRRGAARAGVFALVVTFAGLLAMNWFELLATTLAAPFESAGSLARYADFAALLFLFAAGVFVLRFAVNNLLPESGDLPPGLELAGRIVFGLLTGYIAAAFLAAAVHTYPGDRDFGGSFPPYPRERTGIVMKELAPDYRWLGFTQYVSARVFPYAEKGRVFDGPEHAAGPQSGRWPSFPIRYAKWRESLQLAE